MATDARDLSDAPPLGGVVRVGAMKPRHLDAVVAIEEQTYPRPWPRVIFEAELAKNGRRYLVARLRREVVGFGGVLHQAGDVHITTVAVAPANQGRGIAGRLVYELLLVARAMTRDGGVTLEVRESNAVAQRLYRSFGFEVEGRRPGYYADNGEDALIMWCREVRGREATAQLRRWAERLGVTPPRDLRGGHAARRDDD